MIRFYFHISNFYFHKVNAVDLTCLQKHVCKLDPCGFHTKMPNGLYWKKVGKTSVSCNIFLSLG